MENAWCMMNPWQVQEKKRKIIPLGVITGASRPRGSLRPGRCDLTSPKAAKAITEGRHLANVGRFAAHVWPSDDLKPGFSPGHAAIVFDEVDPFLSLNTGVPAPHQFQLPLIRG